MRKSPELAGLACLMTLSIRITAFDEANLVIIFKEEYQKYQSFFQSI